MLSLGRRLAAPHLYTDIHMYCMVSFNTVLARGATRFLKFISIYSIVSIIYTFILVKNLFAIKGTVLRDYFYSILFINHILLV